MPSQPSRRSRGAGLIESLVALAVVGVLASVAVPSMVQARQHRHLAGLAAQLQVDLHLAQTEAQAREQTLRVALRQDAAASCWLVHSGPAGSCRCSGSAAVADCDAGSLALREHTLVPAHGVRVVGAASAVAIDPVRRTTTPATSFTFESAQAGSLRVVVNITGRSRTCAPAGPVAGYPSC